MGKFDAIKPEFQVDSLKFDHNVSILSQSVLVRMLKPCVKLLEASQCVKLASHSFKMRPIELTAVSLHKIAVHIFQLQLNLQILVATRGLDVDAVVEPDVYIQSRRKWATRCMLQLSPDQQAGSREVSRPGNAFLP